MRQALLRGDNWWLSRQLRRDNDGRGKTHGDVPQGIAGQVARLPVKNGTGSLMLPNGGLT
jgi:hypothetical protein